MSAVTPSWYELTWPREVTFDQIQAVLRALATISGMPCILEANSSHERITHRIGLWGRDLGGILTQLRSAVPGLGLSLTTRPVISINRAREIRFTTGARALRTDDPEGIARSVLGALSQVGRNELLVLQWVLGRPLTPATVPKELRHTGDHPIVEGVPSLLRPDQRLDSDTQAALRAKRSEHGWRAIGRIGVRAATTSRQNLLVHRVLGALRAAESPGVNLRTQPIGRKRVVNGTLSWRYPARVNVSELVVLSGWPVGKTSGLPVVSSGSRALPASSKIPRSGRVLGTSSYPGRERPLALSPADSTFHTVLLGPTGTGKSTLLTNLVAQDMKAGRGVLVLDPKGDTLTEILGVVPAGRAGDVVVIDPTDPSPVGLNPLAPGGRSPELVADQLLSVFHGLYAAYWGPRTQDILHASLLTLARYPGATLAALPLLLSDQKFRRRVIKTVDDPIALGPFWAGFERWSEAERSRAIAPVLNKLRPFLLRPQLRAVIGQQDPKFALIQIFTQRKIVLVNLAKGMLGPEGSALLGALVISQFWQSTLGRAGVPQERRHPVFAYLDEFADYLQLGTDLSDALAQARGLGVGLVMAHQYLHQLDPAMRSAVANNARSRACFQLAPEDARVMAAGSDEPAPEDFTSLGAFECYLQLMAEGAVQPWCSARTLPPPEPVSDPIAVRAASSVAYGIPGTDTEASLRELVFGNSSTDDDLSPRRRTPPTGGVE